MDTSSVPVGTLIGPFCVHRCPGHFYTSTFVVELQALWSMRFIMACHSQGVFQNEENPKKWTEMIEKNLMENDCMICAGNYVVYIDL